MIILAFASGLLGLIASAVLRARAGSGKTEGVADDRFTYLSLPGFSLFLLGVAGLGLLLPAMNIGGTWQPIIWVGVVAAAVASIAGAVFSLWGLFAKTVPTWALPRSKRG